MALLERHLVNGELSRKEDVAYCRSSTIGDNVVVGVANVEVTYI